LPDQRGAPGAGGVVVDVSPVVGVVVSSVVVSSVVGAPGRVGSFGCAVVGLVGPVVCGEGWVGRIGSGVPGVVVGWVGCVCAGTCAMAAVVLPRINRLAKMVLRIENLLASVRSFNALR
jgi:hypothetical protein